MPGDSAIGWTDATWNPVTGCSKVSSGCANCYAETLSLRRGWTSKPWTAPNAEENVVLHPDRLPAPLSWKSPKRVFVNSMSDLFHPLVPDSFIDCVFGVMAACPQHSFQVLTKRPKRMREYLSLNGRDILVWIEAYNAKPTPGLEKAPPVWPLPNVWVGTSVEAQREADQRIPHLVETPAAVRFLSCEPLLGPIYLGSWFACAACCGWGPDDAAEDCTWCGGGTSPIGIQWVIAGGESGPGFRPMDLDWVRSLRDQCGLARVAFFYKQASSFRPGSNRELDGRTWDEFPGQAVPYRAAPAEYRQEVLL